MADSGHPNLVTPYNTSEFYAMAEALRGHHNNMHDALRTIAVALNQSLPRASGSRMPAVRVDLKLNAHRVTRHLVHAAALNAAAARSYTRAYVTFEQLFCGRPTHQRESGFNLDK
jgi:hypothetical protein